MPRMLIISEKFVISVAQRPRADPGAAPRACSNTSMPDEMEQRLAAAARAAREYDLCGQLQDQLRSRERAAAADLNAAGS